jgi:hypothetical protein
MSRAAPHPSATPSSPDDAAAAQALIDRGLGLLTRLADIGMEIAEAAGRRAAALAETPASPADAADPALAYARAARAVRLTVALQSRLLAERAALGRAQAQARAAEAGRRRERIHAKVERTLETDRADADEVEELSSRVWEQLRETEDDDLADRPVAEVVARICRDLGLSPAWAAAAFAGPDPAALGPAAAEPADFTPAPAGAGCAATGRAFALTAGRGSVGPPPSSSSPPSHFPSSSSGRPPGRSGGRLGSPGPA